jgi:hypothetical protein
MSLLYILFGESQVWITAGLLSGMMAGRETDGRDSWYPGSVRGEIREPSGTTEGEEVTVARLLVALEPGWHDEGKSMPEWEGKTRWVVLKSVDG